MYKNSKLKVKLVRVAGLLFTGVIILCLWTGEWKDNLVSNKVAFSYTRAVTVSTLTYKPKNVLMKNSLKLKCRKLPDILIIGFEKCGTVAVPRLLAAHPKIFLPKKEINTEFFNADYNQSISEYTKDLPCTPDGMLMPKKLSPMGIPRKVNYYTPGVKLIAVVKEPVDRSLSQFLHLKAVGKIPINDNRTFDEYVKDPFENDKLESAVFYFSIYADRIKPWIKEFGLDRIFFLDGDRFVQDPVSELQKAEIFLELEPSITNDDFFNSELKPGFYCVKRLGEKDGCLSREKGRKHPVMENSTRIRLQRFFKPHNEMFFNITRHRFQWNY